MSDAQKVEAGQVEDTVIVTVNGKVKYNDKGPTADPDAACVTATSSC